MPLQEICSHKTTTIILSNRLLHLAKCDACGLIINNKLKQDIDYTTGYTEYYSKEAARFQYFVELVVRFFRWIRALRIYLLMPAARKVLDVGSGRGFMLYYLKRHFGFTDVVGTQIEENAYTFSKRKLGLNIYMQDLLDIPFEDNRFDIITIFHVLEHVKEPEKYIQKFDQILDRQGMLLIEVPNYASWSRRLTGAHWLALEPKYHIHFFETETLVALLEKYNFTIRSMRSFSLEYSAFTSTQSLLSWLTNSDHVLFRFLQTGHFSWPLFLHVLLFSVVFPFCFMINLFLYYSKHGENINICATRKVTK